MSSVLQPQLQAIRPITLFEAPLPSRIIVLSRHSSIILKIHPPHPSIILTEVPPVVVIKIPISVRIFSVPFRVIIITVLMRVMPIGIPPGIPVASVRVKSIAVRKPKPFREASATAGNYAIAIRIATISITMVPVVDMTVQTSVIPMPIVEVVVRTAASSVVITDTSVTVSPIVIGKVPFT